MAGIETAMAINKTRGLYVNWLTVVFTTLLIFSFGPPVYSNEILQQGTSESSKAKPTFLDQKQKLVMRSTLADGREAIISIVDIADTEISKVNELLENTDVQSSDILLSTDKEEIVESVLKDTHSRNNNRLLRIIPIGALANAKQKIASGFKNYKQNALSTLRYDRIGLTVLAITVGTDCMIWIHASSFDIHQKTSMIMLNLVMASAFGLDRELWGRMTKPIKNKLINVFDRFIPTENANLVKSLTSRYLSNMLLGTGIQLIRTGLLSLDHIQYTVTTGDFWLTAAKLSGLVTLTSFAWSELYTSIDGEKYPVAKLMMRRFSDMRGVIMCQLASVSMVLQPHVYGSVPIYSYVIHGTIGLVALLNAHRVVAWLENNSVVKRVYSKMQTMENYISVGLEGAKPAAIQSNASTIRKKIERTVIPQKQIIRSCRQLIAS